MSQVLPFRTRVTSFSDDALLLLDAVFQFNGIVAQQFYSDSYSNLMDTFYTHHLSDNDVEFTLQSLQDTGHLSLRIEEFDYDGEHHVEKSWHLTDDGGQLWEDERQPVWSRFIYSYGGSEPSAYAEDTIESDYFEQDTGIRNPWTVVMCSEDEIAQQYIQSCIAAHLINPRNSPPPLYAVKANFEFSYKTFPIMHCYYLPEEFDTHDIKTPHQRIDQQQYESHRTWWKTVKELQIFKNALN